METAEEKLAKIKERIDAIRANLGADSPVVHALNEIESGIIWKQRYGEFSKPRFNADRFNNARDAYNHIPSPSGTRELPPQWVDAISYAIKYLYMPAEGPRIWRCLNAKLDLLGSCEWRCFRNGKAEECPAERCLLPCHDCEFAKG